MTEFINFTAQLPKIGFLQRTHFTRTNTNFSGGQHRILPLSRYQRDRRTPDGAPSAQEKTTQNTNTLSNIRPSTGALLGTKRERRRQNTNGGGYTSSDEENLSSSSTAAAAENSTPRSRQSKPPPRSKIKLDPAAHDISWDACTVRGFEDGSLVFKFDQLDPRIEEEASALSSFDGDGSSTSSSTTATTAGTFSTTSSSLLPTATLANFAWSNAVKLGVKFPQQLEITLRKLEEYLIEFNGKTAPAKVELKHSLFKTYEKAVKRQEKLLLDEGIVAGIKDMMLHEEERAYRSEDEEGGEEEEDNEESGKIIDKGRQQILQQEEQEEDSDSEDVKLAAALEEFRSSIRNCSKIDSTKTAEDQRRQQGAAPIDETSPSPFSFPTVVYDILKAFYRAVILTPRRFFLSIVSSIITWAVHLPISMYRTLPYNFRKIFHKSWPPRISTRHVSPAIHALFLDQSGFNRASLADAGFDAQGRCAEPLAPLLDIPPWRLEQLVGCGISDATLFRTALTHATALPPEARALSYERLEYLGDAVLELCTRQLLMARAPDADEGQLTNQGQFLVAGSTVNKYGAWMGLDKWVLCNTYSMRDGLIGSPHILGDAFEALLAAVYIDRGLEAARKLLIRVFNECPSVEWAEIGFMRDHKGELMKAAQQRRKPLPMYHVVSDRYALYRDDSAVGGDTDGSNSAKIKKKYWTVEVEFDGEVIGSGSSFEKREAEREAAKVALQYLGELNESDVDSDSGGGGSN